MEKDVYRTMIVDWSDDGLKILRNLGDRRTVAMLKMLKYEPKCIGEICEECGVSRVTVYRRFQPLIKNWLIVEERKGRRKYLTLGEGVRKSVMKRINMNRDERRIFDIIRNNRKISQSELVSISRFQRSKVCRIIKKLKDNGWVERERIGMTYLIYLAQI